MAIKIADWIILHIPHSSTVIPDMVRDQFVLEPDELQHELMLMADLHTDELYTCNLDCQHIIQSEASRLVVDVERFADDTLEPMSKIGMGAIYTQTHQLTQLRRAITEREREALMNTWYFPHHRRLEQAVNAVLTHHPRCLIIDCHSFATSALPYELNATGARPSICVGTDDFHTPPNVVDHIALAFRESGYTVALNTPFSGALVPLCFYQKDKRVKSVMIEIRKDMYMDEVTGAPSAHFDDMASCLQQAFAGIYEGLL